MDDRVDAELVLRARRGDLEAFTELVRGCQERVFNTILSLTRNVQDTDDLMQEVFLTAYRNLGRFRGHSSFFTWVYRIAVNQTLNFLKKRKREETRREGEDRAWDKAFDPQDVTPESDSLRLELARKIEEAIESLPLIYRAAFNLVARQGLSHGQAAEALGVTESTVSWRMHRARKMLQKRLRAYVQGGAA